MKICHNIFVGLLFITLLSSVYADNSITRVACPKDYYIAKCGNYTLGTKWLVNESTPNYPDGYDYRHLFTDSTNKNISNFYKFFKTESTINNNYSSKYMPKYEATTDIIYKTEYNGDEKRAINSTYTEQAKEIFNTFCVIQSSGTLNVECEPCPGDGKTLEESKIKLDPQNETIDGTTTTSYKINLAGSTVNTYADCYQDTFVDEKGTYFYPASTGSDDKQKCLYGEEIQGDYLQWLYFRIDTSNLHWWGTNTLP